MQGLIMKYAVTKQDVVSIFVDSYGAISIAARLSRTLIAKRPEQQRFSSSAANCLPFMQKL